MNEIDLIVFDMDGTLYDDIPEIISQYREAAVILIMESENIPRIQAEMLLDQRKAALAARIGGHPTNTLTLMDSFDADFTRYEEIVDSLHRIEELVFPHDGTTALMAAIAKRWPVHLYTTNNRTTTARILRRLGMEEIFPPENRFTLTDIAELPVSRREMIDHIKPGLEGFRRILGMRGADPRRAVMVGDSEVSDLAPARSLGMETFMVKTREDFAGLGPRLGL